MQRTMPISNEDVYLFHEGTNFRSYQFMGAHLWTEGGRSGVRFAVWAPAAQKVRLVGDFNQWQGERWAMQRIPDSGIWVLFAPGLAAGTVYKYEILTLNGEWILKADPYAFAAQLRPDTASTVADLGGYEWQDAQWQHNKKGRDTQQPLLIYEVHLGSWRQGEDGESLSYRQLAQVLPAYVADMGYTHVEFMPLSEHPFDGSWGYQATGYYAVTSRYGSPEDFMYLVDTCHAHNLGVILDWVPGHFCKDEHGLRRFDGSFLYEYADFERGENIGWGTANFDFGRAEVLSFLISNALFWLDVYHIDGLRTDAVSNILYFDHGADSGAFTPHKSSEQGNAEGAAFLRRLNSTVRYYAPQALVIAEEASCWPMVTCPAGTGGLGFTYKWNMGWMHDALKYMRNEAALRKWEHHLLTFSLTYAFSENFILALSHDEVVHGKKSLLGRMPGNRAQQFDNLRAFYGYWMAHPGKKLMFMGGEFGQQGEWNVAGQLEWGLLEQQEHQKLQNYCRQLYSFYRRHPALWEQDDSWRGFEWLDCSDYSQSVICFLRHGRNPADTLMAVCNFSNDLLTDYRIGVDGPGCYREVFSSAWQDFGGGQGQQQDIKAELIGWHKRTHSISLTIPPLATVYLKAVL